MGETENSSVHGTAAVDSITMTMRQCDELVTMLQSQPTSESSKLLTSILQYTDEVFQPVR